MKWFELMKWSLLWGSCLCKNLELIGGIIWFWFLEMICMGVWICGRSLCSVLSLVG